MNQHFNCLEIHTSLYRLQQQAPLAKNPLSYLYSKFPYGMYDSYAAHASAEEKGKAMMTTTTNNNNAHGSSSQDEFEDMSDHPSSSCAKDHQAVYRNHSHY